MSRKTKAIACLILCALTGSGYAASFNCENATLQSEKIVCANPELSILDEYLARTYYEVKQLSSNPDEIKASQINWISNVRKCTDPSCLRAVYEIRIVELQKQREILRANETIQENQTNPQPSVGIEPATPPAFSEDAGNLQPAATIPPPTNNRSEEGNIGFSILVLGIFLVCFAIYILPTLVAFHRDHRHRWLILIVNIAFGATLIGWLVALVWALNKLDSPKKGGTKYDPQPHDPSL